MTHSHKVDPDVQSLYSRHLPAFNQPVCGPCIRISGNSCKPARRLSLRSSSYSDIGPALKHMCSHISALQEDSYLIACTLGLHCMLFLAPRLIAG